MIRISYHNDEDLKEYEVYGIQKLEVIPTEYGDRKYVSFGAGLVVGYGDHYIGDGDSVWHVKIWNPVTKTEGRIGMGYCNGYTPNHGVEYDATPEVKVAWEAWKAEQQAIIAQKEKEANERQRVWEAQQELETPRRGKIVKVVKGRKVAKGTEGKVFWRGNSQYGWRVGLELADGSKVFTAESNVEVIAQGDLDGKELSIHREPNKVVA